MVLEGGGWGGVRVVPESGLNQRGSGALCDITDWLICRTTCFSARVAESVKEQWHSLPLKCILSYYGTFN